MRLVRQEGGNRGGVGESVLDLPPQALERIAGEVGTPVFVYSADKIAEQHRALSQALAGISHRIHYSVKANSSLGILRVIRDLGLGVDIVSMGELARVLRAGFSPADIVFSGAGKTCAELEAALECGVGLLNLESEWELEILCRLARDRKPVDVGIRVNPDVTTDTHPYTQTARAGHKFGVPRDQVVDLARRIMRCGNLRLRSLGMHLGSQISQAEPYRRGAACLGELADKLVRMGVDTLASIDVGGGLGISYGPDPALDLGEFRDAVAGVASSRGLALLVEPGRFLLGNSGCLLTRVICRKRSGGRTIVITDAGMNDFLRPSLYGAYHEIRVVAEGAGGGGDASRDHDPVDVVGPNCETGDFLGMGRRLAGAGPGALLAVMGAGAYGFVMSSNYNSRPRAAEVLVREGKYAVIRQRETVEDLMRGETDSPRWVNL
ncbi:Diaminopimelate decarboxylase [bacterium HR33]|nr:Diaminopimelate decarboxylase [bacterium HR33]